MKGSCVGRVISVAAFGEVRVGLGASIWIGLASGRRRAPTGALVDDTKVVGGTFVAAAQLAPLKGPSCTDGPGWLRQCMSCTAVGTEHLRTSVTVSLRMSAIAMSALTSSVETLARSCRLYWSAMGSAMPSELHTPCLSRS
jgi:hypothetical protein